jgi:DNA-binding CsgD family transcriptional regulator
MTDIAIANEISSKLDTLIRLQAALAVRDMGTQKDKIIFLSGAGIRPMEIASLLGTTSNTVSVTIANSKKANITAPKEGKT